MRIWAFILNAPGSHRRVLGLFMIRNLAVVDCPRPSLRHGCGHPRAPCPATLVATIPHQAVFCVSPHLATLCICPSTRPQEQGAGKMGLTLRQLQELPPGPRMSARPEKGHQGPVCSLLSGERLIHEALMQPAQCPAQSRHSGSDPLKVAMPQILHLLLQVGKLREAGRKAGSG